MRIYTHKEVSNPNFENIEWHGWEDVRATCLFCGTRKSYRAHQFGGNKSCGCKSPKREESEIRIDGDIAYVTLTKGWVAMIDVADVGLATGRAWSAIGKHPNIYAYSSGAYLHRAVLDAPDRLDVDHKDGNRMDCRRDNLRLATRAQNIRNQGRSKKNTSGFKGVTWSKSAKKWTSHITVDRKPHYLGVFDLPEDAHAAYAEASKKYHGEFGRIN